MKKREPSPHHTLLVGMCIGATTVGNSTVVSQKLKMELPYDPTVPPLGIYIKKKKKTENIVSPSFLKDTFKGHVILC